MALVHEVHIYNFGMINKSKTKKRRKIGYNYSIISTVT